MASGAASATLEGLEEDQQWWPANPWGRSSFKAYLYPYYQPIIKRLSEAVIA